MIRAYLPLTGRALAQQWPVLLPAAVLAPAPEKRELRGEEAELWEFRAMSAAAASIAAEARDLGSPRAIIACDLDIADGSAAHVAEGIVVLPDVRVEAAQVVSVHIDDPEGFAQLPVDADEALTALAESDLLWFDSGEVGDLVQLFGDLLPDDGLQG